MKKLVLAVLLMISSMSAMAQSTPSVGPNGIAVPNFTETNRLALSSPSTGLVVYQTDGTTGYYVYTGSTWVRLLDSTTSFNLTSDGSDNLKIGASALNSNTNGFNTAIGANSLSSNVGGASNTALGSGSLAQNIGGSNNVAIGRNSLSSNVSGNSIIAIGRGANVTTDGLINSIAIGTSASVDASNKIQLGNSDITSVSTYGSITSGSVTYPNTDGTNGQVLTTNGSGTIGWTTVSSNFLPLTGGTLTGGISGTTATFSGNLTTSGELTTIGSVNGASTDTRLYVRGGRENEGVKFEFPGGTYNNVLSLNWYSTAWKLRTERSGGEITDLSFARYDGTTETEYMKLSQLGNLSVIGTIKSGSVTYPNTDGTNGQVLTTNGSGTIGWTTISSNSLPLTGGTLTGTLTGTSASFSGTISSNGVSILKSGTQSMSIGESVYSDNGENVTAIGFMTLNGNTSNNNTAIGTNAMRNSGSTSYNTAIGNGAGSYDNTGGYNTFLGNSATLSATGISNSTALGNGATVNTSNKIQLGNSDITSVSTYGKLTTGAITFPNTDGIADQVLKTNGAGVLSWTTVSGGGGASSLDELSDVKVGGLNFNNSILIGSETTGVLTGAPDNVGIGEGVLASIISGRSNTAIGNYSLQNLTTGRYNLAIGSYSLGSNTGGSRNIGLGFSALNSNIAGSDNVAIGYAADVSTDNLSNAIAIGSGAIVDASNKIQLGNTDVTSINTSGAITSGTVTYPNSDGTSGQSIITDGTGNLSWGNPTIISDADFNTYGGTNSFTSLTGTNNASFGYNVLNTNSGNYNSAFGTYSLNSTTGSYNSGYGSLTLFNNTSGQNNSAIGYGALNHNTTGSNNSSNGTNSLTYNTTGSNNVALGSDAGRYASDGETSITVVNNSVFVGENARPLADNQTNQVVIGYNAVGKGSNTVQLGNSAITSVSTYGKLTSGTITYPNTDGTSGQVLTTNGSGTLSWATASATVADASLTSAKFYARTLSANTTLTASDFMIIANGAITITLPSSPVDGQVYMIGTTNSGTTISSSKTIYYSLYSSSNSVAFSSLYTNFVYLIYSSTLDKWMLSSTGMVG